MTSKSVTEASDPAPKLVETLTPKVTAAELRKKELIERVAERSGAKKKDVKPVVDAMLQVLGEAVAEDRELHLPPFAKMKIQKVKQLPTARVTVARLRQSTSGSEDKGGE